MEGPKTTVTGKQYCKKQPCSRCPYRKDVKLAHWNVEEYKDLLKNENSMLGAVYGCHKKDGTVCTGWIMNQDKNRFPSIMLRISLTKNNITREFLDSLTCPVEMYDTVQEMAKSNYPELF
jgi:hypothetical protein